MSFTSWKYKRMKENQFGEALPGHSIPPHREATFKNFLYEQIVESPPPVGDVHLHAFWNPRNDCIDWVAVHKRSSVCSQEGRCVQGMFLQQLKLKLKNTECP